MKTIRFNDVRNDVPNRSNTNKWKFHSKKFLKTLLLVNKNTQNCIIRRETKCTKLAVEIC